MALKKKAKAAKAKVKSAVKKRPAAAKAKPKAKGKVRAIPENYPPMMPYAVISGCASAIEFYKKVFGAKERLRMDIPGGMVAHAELGFGPAVLMVADPMPGFPPSAAKLCLYVKSCDATFAEAVKNGAIVKQEPANQFYGDRSARVVDPFGNEWNLMTHIEDVTPREMRKRMASMAPPAQ